MSLLNTIKGWGKRDDVEREADAAEHASLFDAFDARLADDTGDASNLHSARVNAEPHGDEAPQSNGGVEGSIVHAGVTGDMGDASETGGELSHAADRADGGPSAGRRKRR